jgi:C-terminal peptidase prc
MDLFDLPLPQAVDLIRGPKGTDVRLTIIPAGENGGARKIVTIQRDVIHLEEQKAKARIVDFKAGSGKTARLGVIDLPSFYASDKGEGESATADVASLIRKFQREDVGGLILDLRRNGGGSLDEAINLAGLFLPSGPVVQTRDLAGHIEVCNDKGGPLYTGPLIVLTSRFSASASEIVAGALQDYGRALIVGDSSTFGNGTERRNACVRPRRIESHNQQILPPRWKLHTTARCAPRHCLAIAHRHVRNQRSRDEESDGVGRGAAGALHPFRSRGAFRRQTPRSIARPHRY